MPRSRKYVKMSLENEEERESRPRKMAESMFNPGESSPARKKKKLGAIIDLKQLRGTAHMPKL